MYTQEDETKFGYKKQKGDPFKYTTYENFNYGRYCKSGIAAVLDADTMKCTRIAQVKTNLDNYAKAQPKPFKCKLPTESEFKNNDFKNACKYYYKETGGAMKELSKEYCECSLMESKKPGEKPVDPATLPKLKNGVTPIPKQKIDEGQGYCPFPSQTEVDKYISKAQIIINNSVGVLHTNDRLNLKAILEKLVQSPKAPVKNQTWVSVVRSNFEIQFWPFIQSNQTYTCVNIVMELSPRNLFKLDATKL